MSSAASDGSPRRPSSKEWQSYYAAVASDGPRSTLLHALGRFDNESLAAHRRLAVDLGCGSGRDTVELLRRGWCVVAIDAEGAAIQALLSRPDLQHCEQLTTRHASFVEARWPMAHLVNASFALPFCSPDQFTEVWARILASLRPGGRFAGQLFGDRDSWADTPLMTIHHNRAAVQALLRSLEVELFSELEYDGKTATGSPKHWHMFDIVARRAPDGQ